MRINSAKDLDVYKKAYVLAMKIFQISKTFPNEEKYALTSQIRRSSRSVCLNLREAWSKRRYEAHFISKLTDCDGEVKRWGRNSRLDNIQAAILSYKLQSYNNVIERRREVAQIYQDRLSNLEVLKLPPAPNSDLDHFDVFQNYELEADKRDDLKMYLGENGIGTLIQWGGQAVHQFKQLGFNQTLPKTEQFFKRCIMLPMNVFINNDDIEYICEIVTKFYRE